MARTPSLVIDAEAGTARGAGRKSFALSRSGYLVALGAALAGGAYALWQLIVHGAQWVQVSLAWITSKPIGGVGIFSITNPGPDRTLLQTLVHPNPLVVTNVGNEISWMLAADTDREGSGLNDPGTSFYYGPFSATLAHSLLALALLVIAALACTLVVRQFRDEPFATSITRLARRSGWVIAITGTTTLLLTLIADAATRDFLEISFYAHTLPNGNELVVNSQGWSIPPSLDQSITMLAAGIGIILIAQAFRNGERLRRDTEGLV